MATVFDENHFRSKAAASHSNSGSGGGSVDDTQKRLTAIETTQARTEVILEGLVKGMDKINATLENVVGRLCAIESVMPHLATKADVNCVQADINSVRTEIVRSHVATIKWFIGTALGVLAAAYTLAKIINHGAP